MPQTNIYIYINDKNNKNVTIKETLLLQKQESIFA